MQNQSKAQIALTRTVLISFIFVLLYCPTTFALTCREIMIAPHANWPPTDWPAFLSSIEVQNQTVYGIGPTREVPSIAIPGEVVEDYRLYQVPSLEWVQKHSRSNDSLKSAFKSNPAGYSYRYSFGEVSTNFAVFRNEEGVEFCISEDLLPSTKKYTHLPEIMGFLVDSSYEMTKTLTTLDRVSSVVKRRQVDPKLQDFFKNAEPSLDGYIARQNENPEKDGPNRKLQTEDNFFVNTVALGGGNLNTYKYFRKMVITSEKTVTEIFDTELRHELPAQFEERAKQLGINLTEKAKREILGGLTAGNMRYEDFHKIISELGSEGKQKQRKYLDEILGFVFPDYASRRDWNEGYIRKLYEKAVATVDNTRYIVIRRKLPNGEAGSIIATLGLTRAPYGKIRFFSENSQAWQEVVGPFGTAYAKTFGFDETNYKHAISKTAGYPVPILPDEEYLGEDFTFPRPAVLEQIFRPSGLDPFLMQKYSPDTSKGIFVYSGQIYAPTKFDIAKESDLRGIAYSEIILELFNAVFATDRSPEFNMNGQYLATYNDKNGALYKRIGFKAIGSAGTRRIDGIDWIPLGLSPSDLLHSAQNIKLLEERVSKEFLEQLRDSLNQMLASRIEKK